MMRAGEGDSRLPSRDGELESDYVERLADFLRYSKRRLPERPIVRLPYREPGDDDA